MSDWIVAKPESLVFRPRVDGVDLSTGTATVRIRRNNAGTDEYWSGSAWGGSSTFALTFVVGTGWRLSFTPPASAQGYTLTVEYAHSDGYLGSEEHYVTVKDVDSALSVTNTNPGASARGA